MSCSKDFKDEILKVRREVQLSCDSKLLLRRLKETHRCLNETTTDSNYKLYVAHLVKELVDWITMKQDRDFATVEGQACFDMLENFVSICHQAQASIRSFIVSRLYNGIVTLNEKSDSNRTKLRVCQLMCGFTIEDEQADLFGRIKRVVLKMVKASNDVAEDSADLVINMQRKLLEHASISSRNSDGIRQAALTLFREVFDGNIAILYRSFTVNRTKARLLYDTIMHTMVTIVKPDEKELISLLHESVGYVETILAYSSEHAEYQRFADFFKIYKGISSEPYASCYLMVQGMLQLIKTDRPPALLIESIADRIRTVHAGFPSHALVVKVAIFLTCQGNLYFYSLPQEVMLGVSRQSIDFFEALMLFVRHCPAETVPELCRKCTSSRRHLADKLLSVLMNLSISQARNVAEHRSSMDDPLQKLSFSVSKGCELIKRKLALLEELGCERKQSLLECSMRYGISWVKYIVTILRDQPRDSESVSEIVEILKVLVTVQNRYRFEFLSDLYIVRLLENTYIERSTSVEGSDLSSRPCWANLSVLQLKLLLTIREQSSVIPSEEQSSSISSIVRAIMCCQMNTSEDDPIRSLTIVQLYDHPSFDRHGFAFDCAPSRDEKFVILAEEMNLVAKYKTPTSLPMWEYFLELTKLGSVRMNCLTFGMALHGFNEQEVTKLPQSLLDEVCAALEEYKPTNVLERIKRSASLAMASYQTYSSFSRASLKRMRDVPFKVEHFRNDQIEQMLQENQLDRETEQYERMEAIRRHYADMLDELTKDGFRSLWVLPSIVQISSILDNTARLYQLNYHPHRAVELQLLNLLLVSQRRDKRPLDQCAALAFLLEQHRLTAVLMKQHFSTSSTQKRPPHAGGTLESLHDLAKRATDLLHTYGGANYRDDVLDNRKFQFLNLYLGLAVYEASESGLTQALNLIQQARGNLATCPIDETIGQLIRGRMAQIIFRLVIEYGLCWPDAVPPITFLKLMLAKFNELQQLTSEHTFSMSLATVEMTIQVLQYQLMRYDIGSQFEPQVEQLLKFVFRRGLGLRVMQLLLLYGQMCADMEKLDRCECTLRYLDRLLMLSPNPLDHGKENRQITDDALQKNKHKTVPIAPVKSLPSAGVHGGMENLVDDERKAVSKANDHFAVSNIDRPAAVLHEDSVKAAMEQYLMFRHAVGCGCRYCRYPQYKSMAFQTAAFAVRFYALQQQKPSALIEHHYQLIVEHWRSQMHPILERFATTSTMDVPLWCGPGYRRDLLMIVIRILLQRGQYLVKQKHFAAALKVYQGAAELTKCKTVDIFCVDLALVEDVHFNMTSVRMLLDQASRGYLLRHKRSRSEINSRFNEFLANRKVSTPPPSSGMNDMASLSTGMNKLNLKTPKVDGSSAHASRIRVPPKTVGRSYELLHQAASRRYQMKATSAEMAVSDLTVTNRPQFASARKPKTVNIFIDSPPEQSKKLPVAPATVGKRIQPTFSSSETSVNPKTRKPDNGVVDLREAYTSGEFKNASLELANSTKVKSRRRQEKDAHTHQESDKESGANTYAAELIKHKSPYQKANTQEIHIGKDGRKVRRLMVDDFPSLGEPKASDTQASVKTPQPQKRKIIPTTSAVGCASPALDRSFRDALVLGEPEHKTDTSLIVLDDSESNEQQSEEAIETSFENSHAVSVDKKLGLSLKSYSERKRLLGSGTLSSSAARKGIAKRMSPFVVSKTKLCFDEPSPEQKSVDTSERSVSNLAKKIPSKSSLSLTKQNTRRKTKKSVESPKESNAILPLETMETHVDNIATRTRLRRKRL
ncbi:uncharacterized protein LOC128721535 [Anopheles nili]|uniref:uncharacterized protein LOC128721535 n=1 Tax=Anopheles nili TaxID=185578 RepID=UPI00237ADB04|nr:uncharacterized protein LOC128721535 [Anopheles nili]